MRTGAFAAGGVVLGGFGLSRGQADAAADPDRRGGALASAVAGHGHYAWFPGGPDSWGRSAAPFDVREAGSRWAAQPTDGGGVRCLVEDLPADRNAGFDVHLGPVGDVAAVNVVSRTVETQRTAGPATLFVGLYLDADGDGEFFEWESADGARDDWVGLGGDDEGLQASGADGELTIDDDTEFALVDAGRTATLDALKGGEVEGIDGSTAAALYLGVTSTGGGNEEVVVESMAVHRG